MIIFCDGASNNNTKRSGVGVVFFDEDQFKDPSDPKSIYIDAKPKHIISREIMGSKTRYINPTNNEAEYESLLAALEFCREKDIKNPKIYMDSKLVVNQTRGLWKINYDHLRKLKQRVDNYKDIGFTVHHIRREFNTHADKASKDCLKKEPVIDNPFKEWK